MDHTDHSKSLTTFNTDEVARRSVLEGAPQSILKTRQRFEAPQSQGRPAAREQRSPPLRASNERAVNEARQDLFRKVTAWEPEKKTKPRPKARPEQIYSQTPALPKRAAKQKPRDTSVTIVKLVQVKRCCTAQPRT